MRNTYGPAFERINVSWQFADLGVRLQQSSWLHKFSGGVTTTLPFHSSYYSTDPASITISSQAVTRSKNWWDPYVGAELLWEGAIGSKDGVGWDVYGSTEARDRTVYDYHKANANVAEARQWSINVIAGLKKSGSGSALGRPSLFIRLYRGVNPHGQFRNQRDYKEAGIGVRLVR